MANAASTATLLRAADAQVAGSIRLRKITIPLDNSRGPSNPGCGMSTPRRSGDMTKLSVAVVGAGMGGLATAAALHRAGSTVNVYEQASKFARLGAGIQIGCNAMKVLRGFGLEPLMRASAFYPRSWNNREYDSGDVRFDMIFGETAEARYGAPYLLGHRGDLHSALASAVPTGSHSSRPPRRRHRSASGPRREADICERQARSKPTRWWHPTASIPSSRNNCSARTSQTSPAGSPTAPYFLPRC